MSGAGATQIIKTQYRPGLKRRCGKYGDKTPVSRENWGEWTFPRESDTWSTQALASQELDETTIGKGVGTDKITEGQKAWHVRKFTEVWSLREEVDEMRAATLRWDFYDILRYLEIILKAKWTTEGFSRSSRVTYVFNKVASL